MKSLFIHIFLIIKLMPGFAQQVEQRVDSHQVTPLFKNDKLLKLHLNYSKKDILTFSNDSTYIESALTYQDTEKSLRTIKVELRERGNYRKLNCYYLPLWIKIEKEASQATIFAEDKKLKLVLPCLNSPKSNDHIIKEFIAYQIYELISPYHFDTKLLSIQLTEAKKKKKLHHDLYGIFIQDDKKTASLNKGNLIKRNIHAKNQDPVGSARNALFQYMIGNTDYSITYQHNQKLLFVENKIVPIPYDFDMSGFVNVSYAVVSAINNKALPITNVTDRLYRGFDRDDEILEQIRKEFISNEKNIFSLVDSYKLYFKDEREFTECKNYLLSFFSIIKDDKQFENKIVKKERTELD